MKAVLLVAAGGALGSAGRYLLSAWVMQQASGWRFPLGTFLVNVIGCLAIGVLGGFAVKADVFSSSARLFLFTGVLGGFTTFSAFGLETFHLLRQGEVLIAAAYAAASVLIGLAAVWIGFQLVRA